MAVLDSTLNQYEVLSYFNYKDGNLYKRFKEDKPVGSVSKEGYIVVGFNTKSHFAHRVIFLMFNGYLPNCIDHIDGNRANNKIENLRPANANTNAYNQAPRKNTASNLKNITWHKVSKKWQVKMAVNGNIKYFGLYNDVEYAKFVADAMRYKYHGEFARG
jgi:hypothetical protein